MVGLDPPPSGLAHRLCPQGTTPKSGASSAVAVTVDCHPRAIRIQYRFNPQTIRIECGINTLTLPLPPGTLKSVISEPLTACRVPGKSSLCRFRGFLKSCGPGCIGSIIKSNQSDSSLQRPLSTHLSLNIRMNTAGTPVNGLRKANLHVVPSRTEACVHCLCLTMYMPCTRHVQTM